MGKNKSFLEQIEFFLPVFLLIGFTLLLLNGYLIDRHSYHGHFLWHGYAHMRPKDVIGFFSYTAQGLLCILILCSAFFIDNNRRSLFFLSGGFFISVILGILMKAKLFYFVCPIMVFGLCSYTLWKFLKEKNQEIKKNNP